MKKFAIILCLIIALLIFGCTQNSQNNTNSTTNPVVQSAVPNSSDALSGPIKINLTIRGLTSDLCGSYVTYSGLTDDQASILDDCYQKKYISKAIRDRNATICDEIYNPYRYGSCYGDIATKLNSSGICNQIENIKFQRRSGRENVTTIEACKLEYISNLINLRRLNPNISCDSFSGLEYQDICKDYYSLIKPAVDIKTLQVGDEAGVLNGYFILQDSNHTTQTEEGNATIVITSEDGKTEYYRTSFDVNKNDYYYATLGRGAFQHTDIIREIPNIQLKNISLDQDEADSRYSVNVKLLLTINRTRTLSTEESVSVNQRDFTVRPLADCLIISNVKGEDTRTDYSKLFRLTGNVTNNCNSTKDFVKINYRLFDASNNLIKEDYTYLNPSTLPLGYARDFEINLTYDGPYKQIAAYPSRYELNIN